MARSLVPLLCACFMGVVAATTFENIVGTPPSKGFLGAFVGSTTSVNNGTVGSTGCQLRLVFDRTEIFAYSTLPAGTCSDLAAIPLSGYSPQTNFEKCTGTGQGYIYNEIEYVPGLAPPTASQSLFFCSKFRVVNSTTAELTVSSTSSLATLDCPASFSSLATLSSAPANVVSFGVIRPLGGATFPVCP
ncbi:hypothetical protein WJX74_004485 [Apatococcus lobatus]|uniref:Uncharacterized protein n=1 Tax=Apatococcus lobatus TaxID=904363 RepID=A0AAW1QTB7_9CHLO